MSRIVLIMALLLAMAVPARADTVGSPIPIGIAVAQTTNIALFGQEQVNGAKIAEEYLNANGGVNGVPVKLIFQDTGGDEAGAVNAFQNLITQGKVVAIVGPTLSQQAFAADPLAERAKVPVIAPSNTAKGIPEIGEYIGRISAPMTVVAPVSLKKALALHPGVKKVAVLFAQNDAFSTSETGVFQDAIKSLGLQIVTVQRFQTTDTDFTTQVTAVLGAEADMVVISGLAADSGNLVKQLRQFGFSGPIVGGNGLNSPNMFPVCGSLCEGILVAQAYSPEADNPVNKAFVAAFEKAYKKAPAQFSAQSFAAVQVVVEALRKVGTAAKKKVNDMDLAQVRTALNAALRQGSVMTPLGEISMNKQGEVQQKDFYVSQIHMAQDGSSGKFVLLPR
ncbi:ABC transporter substrate binding protein precursor [Desulfovibrio sp. X2]|uniref:ABC transporter substrate-binding protein n=1 Tax=Desulfovibrio sp. X2 TaxID=941449 RepID=UPI000358BE34|nr:ABC transporter substrate-binding protein [Desulfovibrio sp. X2]EPR42184.1 ABC transporter substrate binding protein precursor [Desulfovibrio sp. X2]